MIRFIKSDDTLVLRSEILRNGMPVKACIFEGDDDPESFHLGNFVADRLVTVVSFYHRSHQNFSGTGYQLRGLATAPDFQKKGRANQLLNFAIVYLRGQKANYIWCNARRVAYRFYESLGFEFISDEFDVPGIGPHREMYLRIQN